MKRIALATSLAVCLAAGVYGQAGGPPPPPPGGPGPHGHFGRPGFGLEMGMHPWKVVTGAPYSATVTEHFTKTLGNQTTISRTTTGQIARDSSGRTYVKQTITGGPFSNAQNGPKTIVFITDPVAGYSYMLDAAKNTAIRRPFHAHPSNGASSRRMRRFRRNNTNRTVTDLGPQTDASGLALQGKQVTRTVPAGAIGNSQAISSLTKTWYSPALQIVVSSTRDDPRFGQSAYNVTDISQSEPDPSLFTVPAGYTVKDAPHWPRGSRRGSGPTR